MAVEKAKLPLPSCNGPEVQYEIAIGQFTLALMHMGTPQNRILNHPVTFATIFYRKVQNIQVTRILSLNILIISLPSTSM